MTLVALMNPPAHQQPFNTPDVFLTELRQAVKKTLNSSYSSGFFCPMPVRPVVTVTVCLSD